MNYIPKTTNKIHVNKFAFMYLNLRLKLTFRLSSCCFWAWFKACNNCDAAFKRFFSSIEASSQKCDRIFSEGIFILKKSQENIIVNNHSRTWKERHIRFHRESPGKERSLLSQQSYQPEAGSMRRSSFDEEHPLTIARADSISGWWKWKKLLQRKEAAKRANCCNSRD